MAMRRVAVLAIAGVLTVGAGCSSGESAATSTTAAPVALGEPVVSLVSPAVVPSNAAAVDGYATSTAAQYLMPAGVTESQTVDWYEANMPSGKDFKTLTWLEALPASGSFGPDWYWCSGPAESLDVSFSTDAKGPDIGRVRVVIAIQDVTIDDSCG